MRLGEAQARRNLPSATETYRAAAAAVASIPIDDPRSTLASVLIDSLISVGRFDDARACVPFYPDDVQRALVGGSAAIAGSQGEAAGSPTSALAWTATATLLQPMRDTLKLHVAEGVLPLLREEPLQRGRQRRSRGNESPPLGLIRRGPEIPTGLATQVAEKSMRSAGMPGKTGDFGTSSSFSLCHSLTCMARPVFDLHFPD